MTSALLAALLWVPPPAEPARAPEFDRAIVIEAAPLPILHGRGPDLNGGPTTSNVAEPIEMPAGPTRIDLPPPPPPPDGAGRLVGGALAIGLGAGAFIAVGSELQRESGNPRYVAGTFVPLGLASLGVGLYMLVRGGKSRANFRHWERYTGYDAPGAGNGLLVGGTILSAISAVVLVSASVRAGRGDQSTVTTVLFTSAGVGLGAGVTQLALGFVRRDRYRRWRRNGMFVLAPPTIGPSPTGLRVGLTARF